MRSLYPVPPTGRRQVQEFIRHEHGSAIEICAEIRIEEQYGGRDIARHFGLRWVISRIDAVERAVGPLPVERVRAPSVSSFVFTMEHDLLHAAALEEEAARA